MNHLNVALKKYISRILPDNVIQMLKKLYYPIKLKLANEDYEADLRVLKYLVDSGDFVLDIGANIGIYTKFMHELVGDSGCVYSIEPIPRTFEILCWNVKRLGLTRVKTINCAISDDDGIAKMEIPLYDGLESSL